MLPYILVERAYRSADYLGTLVVEAAHRLVGAKRTHVSIFMFSFGAVRAVMELEGTWAYPGVAIILAVETVGIIYFNLKRDSYNRQKKNTSGVLGVGDHLMAIARAILGLQVWFYGFLFLLGLVVWGSGSGPIPVGNWLKALALCISLSPNDDSGMGESLPAKAKRTVEGFRWSLAPSPAASGVTPAWIPVSTADVRWNTAKSSSV